MMVLGGSSCYTYVRMKEMKEEPKESNELVVFDGESDV